MLQAVFDRQRSVHFYFHLGCVVLGPFLILSIVEGGQEMSGKDMGSGFRKLPHAQTRPLGAPWDAGPMRGVGWRHCRCATAHPAFTFKAP